MHRYCFFFLFFCQSSRYNSWRMKWQPTPVFLSEESHGQRSLSGCSTQGRKRVGNDWASNSHTRYISDEQLCLKTTGVYEDLLLLSSLFHFFYFIFSAPVSFSLYFPISPSLLFFLFDVLSQVFIKHSRKAFVYIYMHYIYVLENLWIFKFMTFWFHLFDLVWIEC